MKVIPSILLLYIGLSGVAFSNNPIGFDISRSFRSAQIEALHHRNLNPLMGFETESRTLQLSKDWTLFVAENLISAEIRVTAICGMLIGDSINRAAIRTIGDPAYESKRGQTREVLGTFTKELIEVGSDGGLLNEKTFGRVLWNLCPLFPICD